MGEVGVGARWLKHFPLTFTNVTRELQQITCIHLGWLAGEQKEGKEMQQCCHSRGPALLLYQMACGRFLYRHFLLLLWDLSNSLPQRCLTINPCTSLHRPIGDFFSTIGQRMHCCRRMLPIGNQQRCHQQLRGFHLEIHTPSKRWASNVCSFFSGHSQSYWVNIQATCDHLCWFTFLEVAGPGMIADQDMVNKVPLGDLIEGHPWLYCGIADCIYMPTEHMISVFGSALAKAKEKQWL